MLYLTLEEADTYFSTRIGAEPWESKTPLVQTKALNHAERNLSRLAYKGVAVTTGTIFPRDDQTEVPTRVKEAICEEALALLNNVKNESEIADLHVTSTSAAGYSTTLNDLAERPWIALGLASPIAWNLISPYLINPSSFRIVPA